MSKVFDSGALSGLSSENPLVVNHGLGYIPSVYSVQSISGGVAGGFAPMDPEDPLGPAGVYVHSFDSSNAEIRMRDGYSYSGDVCLICYHGS